MDSYTGAVLILLLSIGCIWVYLILPHTTPTIATIPGNTPLTLTNDGLTVRITTFDHTVKNVIDIDLVSAPKDANYLEVALTPKNLQITTADISKKGNTIIYKFYIEKIPEKFSLPVKGVKNGEYTLRIFIPSNTKINPQTTIITNVKILNSI